ncbi:MAG: FAD-dependent oxidoreductase [Gammaproteobacteria bacterium]|nr:FAD-dependent oxidoreductase [Gammaproteobacteria bacterium]
MATVQSISQWHDTADLVIAGAGVAGCATAIHAIECDAGLDVLMLEKMPEDKAGGNSRVSGQTMFLPRDVRKTIGYQRQLNATNPVPEAQLRSWAEEAVMLEPWVESIAREAGFTLVRTMVDDPAPLFNVCEFPEFEDSDVVEYIGTLSNQPDTVLTPSGLWEAFRRCVQNRPVRRQYNSPVMDLVQDPDSGEVFGVQVRSPSGETRNIRARRGVVLAVGGYENDIGMLRSYAGLHDVVPLGSPANTGDGVRILQRAGAEMYNFTQYSTLAGGLWPAIQVPGEPTAFMRQIAWDAWSWIDIAQDSSRFIDESVDYRLMHYKEKRFGVWRDTAYPRVGVTHMVFDDATREAQKLVVDLMTWSALVADYRWSEDNSAEVSNGVIVSAGSIRELAEKIGRDPGALEATVDRYNAMVHAGVDGDFGRPAEKMHPLDKPPFHALRILPGVICTGGGAVRNGASQVISTTGDPVPRLYSAGELGSIHTGLYQLGGYLAECMATGRVAARSLVGAQPWC